MLHPSTTAVIASDLLQTLRESGQLSAKKLADKVGSTVPDDSFRRALHLAVADGLIIAPDIQDRGPKEPIHDDDELSARTADLILQSHPLVRASGQVDEFRSRVVEKVYEMGAATLDELREGLDVDDLPVSRPSWPWKLGSQRLLLRECSTGCRSRCA